MAVAASILVMRRLEQRERAGVVISRNGLLAPTLAGAGLAVWVAAADYFFAQTSQTAAQKVCAAYKTNSHKLWFQGHWGFQYYMEQQGAAALNGPHVHINPGDYIAAPSDNTNVDPLSGGFVVSDTIYFAVPGLMTTMNLQHGSGFYTSLWGPLPFAFGPRWNETVQILIYEPAKN
jgi:hypothetical protein